MPRDSATTGPASDTRNPEKQGPENRNAENAEVVSSVAEVYSSTSVSPPEGLDSQGRTASSKSPLGNLAPQFVSTVGVAFAIVGIQMAQGILLARILGPVGRGEYATAIFYSQLLLFIGLFGGLEVICRHAASSELDTTKLRRAAFKLGLVTGTVTTAIAITLCVFALPQGKQSLFPLAVLCSLSITGQQVMWIMTAVDRGRGDFHMYNLRRLFAAAAFPVLLLGTQVILGVTLEVACVLCVVASLASMVVCLGDLQKPLRGPSEPTVPRLLEESRPYALSMFATDLFERMDLLLILWLASFQDQGYYAAMAPVVYPLTVIPNTLGFFLFNAGANQNTRLTTPDVNRILASSVAVQTACTIVFMLLIGYAINLLYGTEFAPAVRFALWLAPVAAVKGILQGLDSYVKGRGKPLVSVRCRVVAAVVMVVLVLLLHESYGAISVAMAALVSQLICFAWLSAIVYADVRDHAIEQNPQ